MSDFSGDAADQLHVFWKHIVINPYPVVYVISLPSDRDIPDKSNPTKTQNIWRVSYFFSDMFSNFRVCLQTIYSVRAGKRKGGNVFFLAIETYPLVEKSWRRWYSALALQCIPAPQLAFFFLPYNMQNLAWKSQKAGWRGGRSLSLICAPCNVTLLLLTVLSFHISKLNGFLLWLSWVGVTVHMAFGL